MGCGTVLEEIIVTAERWEMDIQNIATSVSVRGGQELQEQGKYSLRQILEDVPGVTAVDIADTNQCVLALQWRHLSHQRIRAGIHLHRAQQRRACGVHRSAHLWSCALGKFLTCQLPTFLGLRNPG